MKILLKKLIRQKSNVVNKYKFYKWSIICKDYPKINGIIHIVNRGKVILGENIKINSGIKYNPIGGNTMFSIHVSEGGVLEIGDNCALSNTAICCRENIKIKENVYIGGDCRIYDTDFHSIKKKNRMKEKDMDVKNLPVIINKGAFIGASCIILKGVNIGENSVIGAGSVVTKNIPSNQIWAGNPARYIKDL